jgi:iron(III) transport system permease protein
VPDADQRMSHAAASMPIQAGGSHWQDHLPAWLLAAAALALCVFLLLPIATLLAGSVQDAAGHFSLSRFSEFAATAGMLTAVWNTLWIAAVVTLITVPLAFVYAYAIQRACVPFTGLWRIVGLSALLGPSLVGAISFIQWFGTQGVLTSWLAGNSVYGPIGIILATVYASFPHALMILVVALATADGRLYEAADALSASRWRKFHTVTLPGARYGLISAALVVFSYSVSEFGIPKVIGGNFQVLAVEIYVQVIGLQNFGRGAVVALLLLVPVLFAFVVDWQVQRKQQASLTARAVPYVAKPDWRRDLPLLVFCLIMAIGMLGVLGMAAYTSVVSFWPYNLKLTSNHYIYGLAEAGVLEAYLNSLKLAVLTAAAGTPFIFVTAYLIEKTRGGPAWLRPALQAMAALPMGVPGLVLGIGYILFFNHPDNPLNGLYHTLTIMVVANIVHYYTSCHLTALTALKSIDREFEAVSASLKVPQYITFWRVSLPVCLPAVLDISRYLFINAMTTVSALVFLYSPQTLPASVSILNLDEAGELGPAAAMATLIVLTCLGVSLLYAVAGHFLLRRHQAWRQLKR